MRLLSPYKKLSDVFYPKQKRVKHLLLYNPKSGIFTWRVHRSSNARKGSVAGGPSKHGYTFIGIDNRRYTAHALAFLYMKGYVPKTIDHINQNGMDNRWSNIRSVSRQCNQRNIHVRSDNTSGVKGVALINGLWTAYIEISGRRAYLYAGNDKLEAVSHRFYAEQCLNWNVCEKSSTAYLKIKEFLCR